MKVVILGAGVIGSYLATTLAQEQHDVIIIDQNAKALEKVARSADVATRLGSGTDWRILEEINELSPDLFIAMSSNDETNLVACAMAKNLGYPKTVARIRQKSFLDHSRLEFTRLFYVDYLLGTELSVAHELFKHITSPHGQLIGSFALGSVQLRTIIIPAHFKQIQTPLSNVKLGDHFLIGLIRRKLQNGQETIIFPKGDDQLLAGDEITLVGETHAMHTLPAYFEIPKNHISSVMIVGGSGPTTYLCRLLEEQNISIKLIEQDEIKCQQLAKLFPKVTILNHDGTDFAFLQEEGVENVDLFVSCTHSHETNILAAALAKQGGCKKVLALVSDESSLPLLNKLGISHALSEKACVARQIHSILEGDSVVSVASLYEDKAKIIEVKISAQSQLVGSPLADLSCHFPSNFLIAMIENRSGAVVPQGHSVLTPGDTAIVICSPDALEEVRRIF